jgi:hypothetical protein
MAEQSALQGLAFGDAADNAAVETEPHVETEVHVEEPHVEPAPDQAVLERDARSRGWRPRDQFRGRPEEWVDAGVFMDRVQQVMPILKSELRRTTSELEETRGLTATLQHRLEEQGKEIEKLKATGTAQGVEQQRETLVAGIMQAREAGDTRSDILLSAKLAALEGKPAAEPAKETPAAEQPKVRDNPVFKEWADENPWWTEDPIKRATATGVAQKLAADHRLDGLTPRERLDLITAETDKYIGVRKQVATTKVSGTRPTGNGAQPSGSGKGWDDLPPNAKAQAMRQASKFKLVGDGKAFKTNADWQKFYAQDYNKAGIPVQIVEVPD